MTTALMGPINQLIEFMARMFRWFTTISPWERGIRVRLGKHLKLLEPGWHLTIPFLDVIYSQTIRLRAMNLAVQTLSTQDGRTMIIGSTMSYSIRDIVKLYQTLHQPDVTLAQFCMAAIAEYVATHTLVECEPALIEEKIDASFDFDKYGLEGGFIKITDIAVVKTYRLVNDQRWFLCSDLDTVRNRRQLQP